MSDSSQPQTPLAEPENALPAATLGDLPQILQDAAHRAGWSSLMDVQAKAIPYLRQRRDLMIQSRTGSGKTGAFLLPILEHIDTEKRTCQALILVPTRELAQQVAREAEMLRSGTELNVVTVYGGVGYGAQLEGLRKGAHLVVGTPGRILDHLMRGTLSLKELSYMVFDEADRLLSMGFYPDMRQVQTHLPKRRSTFMFSATFPAPVRALAREFMQDPGFLSLSRDNEHVTDISHVAVEVDGMDKDRALVRIIEIDNPSAAIIFCNTKMKVHYVATILKRFGYDADELTSDLNQNQRDDVLRRVHAGQLRFLVATDVAARGLDIEGLPYVFQFELPDELETYVHRAGRTGRAGAEGTAISLYSLADRRTLTRIKTEHKIEFEQRVVPTDEDVARIVAERLVVMLEAKLRGRDRIHTERMQRLLPLVRSLATSDEGLALLAMGLDDEYQMAMHSTPTLPSGKPAEKSSESAPPRSREGEGGGPSRGRRGGGRPRR